MARSSTAEAFDADIETVRRDHALRVKINPPKAGEEVVIKGNFLAREGDPMPWAGYDDDHIMVMTVTGNVATVDLADVEVGRTYEFSIGYRDITDSTKVRWTTKLSPEGKGINDKVKIPPEGEKSPNPTAPRVNVHQFVKKEVGRILEAGGSRKTATSLEALFRGLETQLRGAYGVREDLSAMMLAAAVEAIRERKQLPLEVRNQFIETNPPSNFDELDTRLEMGAELYREAVFVKLLGDEDAREFFGLNTDMGYDDSNPLGRSEYNAAFVQRCNSRCLGGFGNVLGESLKRTADVTVVNSNLQVERRALLGSVVGRLPTDDQRAITKIIDRIPANRRGKLADLIANGGLSAAALLIDPTFGIGTLALKAALEGLTGVSLGDVVKAHATGDKGPLMNSLIHNNIAVHAVTKEGGFWGRLKEILGRAIPLWGMKHAGKSVSGYNPNEGAKQNEEEKPKKLPAKRDADALINKACDAALKH